VFHIVIGMIIVCAFIPFVIYLRVRTQEARDQREIMAPYLAETRRQAAENEREAKQDVARINAEAEDTRQKAERQAEMAAKKQKAQRIADCVAELDATMTSAHTLRQCRNALLDAEAVLRKYGATLEDADLPPVPTLDEVWQHEHRQRNPEHEVVNWVAPRRSWPEWFCDRKTPIFYAVAGVAAVVWCYKVYH
jgi:hypothetical protein